MLLVYLLHMSWIKKAFVDFSCTHETYFPQKTLNCALYGEGEQKALAKHFRFHIIAIGPLNHHKGVA